MPSAPGYCPLCDLVFDGAGGIHIENSVNVTLLGNSMPCPNCGRPAKLVDGTFNVRGEDLELVAGPPLTVEVLERLRDIAERATAGETTPAGAIQEAKELDPVLGKLFERFISLGLNALAALIALITVYLQHLSIELQREGIDLQRGSLALQQQDSNASTEFYRDALRLLAEHAVEAKNSLDPRDKILEHKGDRKTKADAKKKMVIHEKSKRRAEVKKQIRIELKERRRMFPRRTRRPL